MITKSFMLPPLDSTSESVEIAELVVRTSARDEYLLSSSAVNTMLLILYSYFFCSVRMNWLREKEDALSHMLGTGIVSRCVNYNHPYLPHNSFHVFLLLLTSPLFSPLQISSILSATLLRITFYVTPISDHLSHYLRTFFYFLQNTASKAGENRIEVDDIVTLFSLHIYY